ncbi:methionine transporter, partial [Acinetobacter baumannii]
MFNNLNNYSLYTTNFTEPLSYQGSAFLKLPKF